MAAAPTPQPQIDPQTGERVQASAAPQIDPVTGERVQSSPSATAPPAAPSAQPGNAFTSGHPLDTIKANFDAGIPHAAPPTGVMDMFSPKRILQNVGADASDMMHGAAHMFDKQPDQTPQQWLDGLSKQGGQEVHSFLQDPVAAYEKPVVQAGIGLAGGAAIADGGSELANLIPTQNKAGGLFQDVMGAAADRHVNLTRSGDQLLRVRELADNGTSMPQAAGKLLGRVTKPDAAPLTYREARDFASNISRASANETMRLSPPMQREMGLFSRSFNADVGDAAADAGKGTEYDQAMKMYARAAKNSKIASNSGKLLLKYGVPGGAAYEGYKAITKK